MLPNSVYAYSRATKRFSMQFEERIYEFTYDFEKGAVTGAWDESGKFLARTYKGFRTKAGVEPQSGRAKAFIDTIGQVKQYQKAAQE